MDISLLSKVLSGQDEVMKTMRPDMSELEIQGLHEYVHKKYGAEEVGYGSIIGAGDDGCILHYEDNTKTKINLRKTLSFFFWISMVSTLGKM